MNQIPMSPLSEGSPPAGSWSARGITTGGTQQEAAPSERQEEGEGSRPGSDAIGVIPKNGVITAVTRRTYAKRVDIMRRYSEVKRSFDIQEPVGVTVLDTVDDLIARTDLSASSRAAYRSALVWYLREQQDQSETSQIAYLKLLQMDSGETPLSKRTAKRAIPPADYDALYDKLNEMATRSTWAVRTLAWVHATFSTGARPIEWLNTHLETDSGGNTFAVIQTAKGHADAPRFITQENEGNSDTVGNGIADDTDQKRFIYPINAGITVTSQQIPLRVLGATRSIPLSTGRDLLMTQTHLDYFKNVVDPALPPVERLREFHKYHDQCRFVLRKACEQLWQGEKHYSLYTFRGQFQANQRALLGAAAAAALMGHSTAARRRSSYGRVNQAFPRFKGEHAGLMHEQATQTPDVAGTTDAQGETPAGTLLCCHDEFVLR